MAKKKEAQVDPEFYGSWRGTVGVIKATGRPGSLEEFMRLLPEGVGIVPLFLGIKKGSEDEFADVMKLMKLKIAELARMHVDLIHPEAAPVFMLQGYKTERKIIKQLQEEHGIPMFTSGMSHVEALRSLGVKKMLGVTYFQGEINKKYARYFQDAGFEVLGMEGISSFFDIKKLAHQQVYAFVKKQFLKHKKAEGIYMLGSAWQGLEYIKYLEKDLRIPVVHPITARVWAIQKKLYVREPLSGYGRLLEELP